MLDLEIFFGIDIDILSKSNICLCICYRDLGTPQRGFGSVLPRHNPDYNKFHLESTHRADFTPPDPEYTPVPVSGHHHIICLCIYLPELDSSFGHSSENIYFTYTAYFLPEICMVQFGLKANNFVQSC